MNPVRNSTKKRIKRLIRKHRKIIAKGILVCLLFAIFYGGYSIVRSILENREVAKVSQRGTKTLSFLGRPYTVVVADTDETREQGLSDTLTIPYDGMLFVFEEEEFTGFWMEDMNYSIDIVWLNDDQTIIDITKEVSPKTYPKVFYPKEPVKYVLEFPSGFTDSVGMQIGSRIDLGKK